MTAVLQLSQDVLAVVVVLQLSQDVLAVIQLSQNLLVVMLVL